MSDETDSKREINRIIVHSYPKTIYLWPTVVVGIVIWLLNVANNTLSFITGVDEQSVNAMFATIWLLFMGFNLIVISFDFSLGKTFSIFVTIVVIILGYVLIRDALNIQLFEGLPSFTEILQSLSITVDPAFYMIFSVMVLILYVIMFIEARLDYWEFQSNRIIHHRGFFEREESFPAQQSRVITQTTDIFERLLFRSGTIYVIDSDKHVHKLENVYKAADKDQEIQNLMTTINVKTD